MEVHPSRAMPKRTRKWRVLVEIDGLQALGIAEIETVDEVVVCIVEPHEEPVGLVLVEPAPHVVEACRDPARSPPRRRAFHAHDHAHRLLGPFHQETRRLATEERTGDRVSVFSYGETARPVLSSYPVEIHSDLTKTTIRKQLAFPFDADRTDITAGVELVWRERERVFPRHHDGHGDALLVLLTDGKLGPVYDVYHEHPYDCGVGVDDYQVITMQGCWIRGGPGERVGRWCEEFIDTDGDQDADLKDFAVFQRSLDPSTGE